VQYRQSMSENDPEFTPNEFDEGPPLDEDQDGAGKKPSLVLNVYSWWTPILAVVMLVVGLVGGYLVRPYIADRLSGQAGSPTEAAAVEPAAPTAGTPQPTVDPTQVAESRDQMMSFLVGQARHFKGDENAPITIIEFSDFQ